MDKLKVFENGLRLVQKKIEGVYSVTIGVWVGAGSSDEAIENNGISHFIEHMLFKGTTTKSAFDIVNDIDSIGAQINAFTSKECTCYYTKSTAEHKEKALSILADLLLNSVFDGEEMEREKSVILEEISMVEDLPDDKCLEILSSAYFKDHPLGKTILGSVDNVKGFNKQNIIDYMNVYYNPKNIVISVCGAVEFDEVEKLVEKYFVGSFNTTPNSIADRAKAYKPTPSYMFHNKETEQSHIALAFPSLSFNNIKISEQQILNNILGGGMSSRLFQSVREKLGLAYTVYSYISTYKNNGTLTIYAGVNPSNVTKTVETIKSELDNLIKNGVTRDEFSRGKEQLKGALVLAQESTSSIMNAYGKFMLMCDEMYDMKKKLEYIDAISFDDINESIKQAYNFEHVCASYVGKKKFNVDILKILN